MLSFAEWEWMMGVEGDSDISTLKPVLVAKAVS